MRKHFTFHPQSSLPLNTPVPEHVREQLRELKRQIEVRRVEDKRERRQARITKQQRLAEASLYETWQEVQLSSIPLKGRR